MFFNSVIYIREEQQVNENLSVVGKKVELQPGLFKTNYRNFQGNPNGGSRSVKQSVFK